MSISWVAYPNVLLGSANSIKMLSYCTRIAARPPISQPEARKTAVTITLGLNDEFPLQGCTREHLLEDAVWGLPHAAAPDKSRKQMNRSLASPPLTCAHILADLVRNVRPEASRFPKMTLSAPRRTPQRPQRSGRWRSTRRPENLVRRRRSCEKEGSRKKTPKTIPRIACLIDTPNP